MSDEQEPDVPPPAMWWQPAPESVPVTAWAQPHVEEPGRKRRRWRKPLLISLVVLLVLGGAGAGAKAYVDHRADVRERERIAAEKRAAEAYVNAVRPIAARVYDAVQPIQDAGDAFEKLRPGLWEAYVDVVLHGGAPAELAAARKALVAVKAPATYSSAGIALETGADTLIRSLKELQTHARTAGKSTEGCAGCEAYQHFDTAVTQWQSALARLSSTAPLHAPGPHGGVPVGTKRKPTVGGFIHASDLICTSYGRKYALLPDGSARQQVESFPKAAKLLRASIAALKAVPLPAAHRSFDRRLDIQLSGVASFATTMEKLHSAYRAHSLSRYRAALTLFQEQLRAFDTVSKTYKARGASECVSFFQVDDKDLKKAYAT